MEGITFPSSLATNLRPVTVDWTDYVVFGSVFLVSIVIAILIGLFRKDKKSSEEFLMGSRSMGIFPVSIALISGCISTLTIVGAPMEVYLYGAQYGLRLLALVPLALIFVHYILPIHFNMELDSPFQYFERRFSRSVHILVSTLSLVQMIFYSTLVVHTTSSYLEQVIPISSRLIGGILFMTSVFISIVGGFSGVVWTTTLQTLFLLSSLTAIVVLGFLSESENTWSNLVSTDPMNHFKFDPDPRTGHTVWTNIFGTYCIWLAIYAGSQTQIQRLISMPSIWQARRACILSFCGLGFVVTLCFLIGMLMLRKFASCDLQELVSSGQIFTNFTLGVLGQHPGLIGILLAIIAAPCLGTVSSTINSMASLVAYDFLPYWIPNISQESIIFLSKILNVLFGAVAFGFLFAAENADPFLPTGWTICVLILGLILGLFSLGAFFPFANSKGSTMGMLSTLAFSIYTLLLPARSETDLLTEKCPDSRNTSDSSVASERLVWVSGTLSSVGSTLGGFSMSPVWYAAVGYVGTLILGLLFSLLFVTWQRKQVSPECFSPSALKFWIKRLPYHVGRWIGPDENLFFISSEFPYWAGKEDDRAEAKEKNVPRCNVEITPVYELTL